MARLSKNILGTPSGKLGQVVFKVRNGKPYLSTLPIEYERTPTPKSIEVNNKFGFLGSLSKSMTDDFFIRTLWEKSDIKGEAARNKIIHVNLPLVDADRTLDHIRIVPSEDLLEALLMNVEEEENSVTITVAPFNVPLSDLMYPFISAHGFMHLYEPLPEINKKHHFIHVQSDRTEHISGSSHTFTVPFNNPMINNFGSKKIHLTLIFENQNGEPDVCSANIIC